MAPFGMSPRKRAVSDARRPETDLLNPNNYVPMQYYNSPRFVGLPMSPGPMPGQPAMQGYMPGPNPYHPYPMGWPSPQFFPAEMASPQMNIPFAADPRSTQVHVLLAPPQPQMMQAKLLYDVRYKPDRGYILNHTQTMRLTEDILEQPVTNPAIPKIRLICRDLPWRITVANPKGVTVGDILEHVYKELQQPLTEGEWWIAQDEERDRCLEAYKRNCSDDAKESKRNLEDGVKRVDWLAKKTMLVALLRTPFEESFIKTRITDEQMRSETWVLDMGEASE